jgi:hypothetical protein
MLAGVAACLAACPVPNLYDPQGDPVMLGGIELEVMGTDSVLPSRLQYRLRVYGYRLVNGYYYVRYLDAGDVEVAGRRARRNMVRVGEPEYLFEGAMDSLPVRLRVEVAGAGQVPPCELEIGLPALLVPPRGGEVPRGRDLVLPLSFAPDPLPPEQSIGARVELSGGVATVALERRELESALIVPGSLLAEVPPGPAALALHLEWRQMNPPGGSRCAPQVAIQAVYDSQRRVWLR